VQENIQTLNNEGKNNTNLNTIMEVFNKYFSGAADTIHKQIKENCKNVKTKSISYMT
jgi:chemotaxis protein CheY-P-specific phosphatase CheC